jgi:hypothetical protein
MPQERYELMGRLDIIGRRGVPQHQNFQDSAAQRSSDTLYFISISIGYLLTASLVSPHLVLELCHVESKPYRNHRISTLGRLSSCHIRIPDGKQINH